MRGEINPNYHEPNRPHFDAIEMKGGGDAVSAARAVLQTGEFDYAWNMQVEDEILKRFEEGGKGRVIFAVGGRVEHVLCNFADPWTEVDGERSSAKTRHPILSDPAVREALNLLVDRGSIQEYVYGRGRDCHAQLPEQPRALPLAEYEVGIQRRHGESGARGGRLEARCRRHSREGRQETHVPVPDVDQRPAPEEPADHQAGLPEGGHRLELKTVMASVFFSSDVANPDTNAKFYADLEMFNIGGAPDPWFFMNQFYSGGDRLKGEQVAGPQPEPLAQRRIRQGLYRRQKASSIR